MMPQIMLMTNLWNAVLFKWKCHVKGGSAFKTICLIVLYTKKIKSFKKINFSFYVFPLPDIYV